MESLLQQISSSESSSFSLSNYGRSRRHQKRQAKDSKRLQKRFISPKPSKAQDQGEYTFTPEMPSQRNVQINQTDFT